MTAPVFVLGAGGSTTFSTTHTQSFDVGSAAGRCLLVLATNGSSNATSPSSATYAGAAMTAGTLSTATTGQQFRLFWLFNVVATGSNNIVVTYSDGNGKPDIVAACYSGVDTAAGVSGEVVAHGLSTSAAWTVSSATGDLVVALGVHDSGSATADSAVGPAVLDYSDKNVQIYDSFVLSSAGGASVTITDTLGSPTPDWWGAAVSLKAIAGGAANQLAWITA